MLLMLSVSVLVCESVCLSDCTKHRSVQFLIQIPYRLFELYVHHVAADKLVNIPTKLAASSVERC